MGEDKKWQKYSSKDLQWICGDYSDLILIFNIFFCLQKKKKKVATGYWTLMSITFLEDFVGMLSKCNKKKYRLSKFSSRQMFLCGKVGYPVFAVVECLILKWNSLNVLSASYLAVKNLYAALNLQAYIKILKLLILSWGGEPGICYTLTRI